MATEGTMELSIQEINAAPTAPPLETENAANTNESSWETFLSSGARTTDNQIPDVPKNEPSAPDMVNLAMKPSSSSTAYSFTGSALVNDATDNFNESAAKKSTGTTNTDTKQEETKSNDDKNEESTFECNICLDTARDAVVSMCGHLFCWPCLHQWLQTRPNRKLCPVCKAAIGKDKVIPLYGRNSEKQEDPRNKVPPRPAGQRIEPEPQVGFPGFGFGDGFHMSFGIGAFPFGFFASSFNVGDTRPAPAAVNRGTGQFEDEQQLSKLFLYLAFLCIAWLLFA